MVTAMLRGPFRALGSPRFAILWAAQALSVVADRAYLVAFALQLGVLDGRPGLLAAALAVSSLCLTLPMLLAVAVSGGGAPAWLWIVVAGLVGLGDSLFYPAFGAVVPELVDREHLASAN